MIESKSIRAFQEQDELAVTNVWYRSGKAAYHFLSNWQTFTFEQAHSTFCEVILPRCDIWVGMHNENVVAFLAINHSYIDRMYVDPEEWRKGWGRSLVFFAKTLHPTGLELHTHQQNHPARRLYELNGFKAVRFGTSPAPENAPDVEYHWRPNGETTTETPQLQDKSNGPTSGSGI
jgi:GNAT superfamily N-acetyltransferase